MIATLYRLASAREKPFAPTLADRKIRLLQQQPKHSICHQKSVMELQHIDSATRIQGLRKFIEAPSHPPHYCKSSIVQIGSVNFYRHVKKVSDHFTVITIPNPIRFFHIGLYRLNHAARFENQPNHAPIRLKLFKLFRLVCDCRIILSLNVGYKDGGNKCTYSTDSLKPAFPRTYIKHKHANQREEKDGQQGNKDNSRGVFKLQSHLNVQTQKENSNALLQVVIRPEASSGAPS